MINNLFKDYSGAIKTLLNSFKRIVIVFDGKSHDVICVNNQFYDYYSSKEDEVIGKPVSDFISYDGKKLDDILLEASSGHEFVESKYSLILDYNVIVTIKKFDYPGHNDFIALIEPILNTEKLALEKANERIEKELEMVQAFFYTYREVYYIDLDTLKYLHLTSENIRQSDFEFEGYISQRNKDMLVDYANDEYKAKVSAFLDFSTLKERLKGRVKINEEFVNGVEGWCRIGFIVCSFDEHGDPSRVLFTFRTINEAKAKEIKFQEAVKDAYKSAKKANDIKTEFLSRMGHDIRTPLNSIIGMALMAKSNIDDKEKLEASLTKIVDTSNQLTSLFSEVLDMSKIEAGNITFARDEIDLAELFTNLIHNNRDEIYSRGHCITFNISNIEHEFILGDKTRLQQTLNNVLQNSIRYTQDHGKIDITVNEKKDVNNSKIVSYEIIIEDNGIGMSEEFLERALEPFERENRPQVLAHDGAGLGLAIANSFAVKMGGNIKIKSKIAMGTKVIVTIFAEVIEKYRKAYENMKDIKVLIVDDNRAQVRDVIASFNKCGAKAMGCSSAQEAIKILKENEKDKPFDVVLITWYTPSFTGPDVIATIRNEKGITLPKLGVMYYDIDSIKHEAKEIGIDNIFVLPLTKGRINTAINKLSGGNEETTEFYSLRKEKQLKGKKVLIVEDNSLNREILREFLEMRGIDIYEASDGKEAVNAFLQSEDYFYDLILMDIQMPIMNGYQATMAIRGSGRDDGKHLPIIAMTASTFADDINASMIAGMDEHIGKPLNFNTLHHSLEKWFNGEYASRKLLELKAETDSFTNVLNKTATFDRIRKYLQQDNVPLSAMMIVDLDNFKNVNDKYGHAEGDQVIKETTYTIKELFRENDIIGRFGGDEFIIFMKNISSQEIALERANAIVSAIAKKFVNKYKHVNVTASVGVAFTNKPMSEDKLFVMADQALYRAKNSGKNKISYAKLK